MDNAEVTNIFISYSHENTREKNMLVSYIGAQASTVRFLSDDNLQAGDNWSEELQKLREKATIFLLLVSPAYLASKAVEKELDLIFALNKNPGIKIIPVILQSCDWQKNRIGQFQAIPKNGKPVAEFNDPIVAFQEITQAIMPFLVVQGQNKAMERISLEHKERTGILDLGDCSLNYIPSDLLLMPWLKELRLDHNEITVIGNLERLTMLEALDLSFNKIRVIKNLSNLRRLKILSLAYNEIGEIVVLNSLTNLEHLDLEHNRLERIKGLNKNLNLKMLDVSSNYIRHINNISQLTRLEKLFAGHNQILEIYGVGKLSLLKKIVLSGNQLFSLKSLLELIRNGLQVFLDHNFNDREGIFVPDNKSLAEPPPETILKGNKEIIRFFEEAERVGLKDLDILKLVLVGNSRVGKTNFSEFLRTGKISEISPSTDMLDIKIWPSAFKAEKKGGAVVINIFDFGGQDYYHDAHRMFYSHDTAYVLLWDKETNLYQERIEENSAITYEDFPLEYWLESINYNLSSKFFYGQKKNKDAGPPVLVIQNKIDLGEEHLNLQLLDHDYKNIYAFLSVALKVGKRVGIIEEVMSEFIRSIQLTGRKLIAYEFPIVSFYLYDNKTLEVLSLDEFWQDCVKRIDDPKVSFERVNAEILADMLNNIGLVYYDQGEKIYTHIGKLNEEIKKIMDLAKAGNDNGLFYTHQLAHVLHAKEILGLLSKNNSILQIGPDVYLAPQFLPSKTENDIKFFLPAFSYHQVRFIYKAYFHKNILLNLLSNYLSGIKFDLEAGVKSFPFWRNGVIIGGTDSEEKQMVFVEFKKEADHGTINIRTLLPYSKNGLAGSVTRTLEGLNQDWTVEKQISVNGEHFFNVKELKTGVSNKQFVFHEKGNAFSINDFKNIEDFDKLPKKLFISYSSKNGDYMSRFATHLQVLATNGTIEPWYDRMIEPGKKWDDAIREEMKRSDLVIFLLSPDFLATDYIMKTELPLAIDRFGKENSKFFFIELQPCSWEMTGLAEFQQTGDPEKPVKNILSIGHPSNDEYWKKVVTALVNRLNGL